MKPVLILGCIRSGTTILHELLLKACPEAVDLTDDDFESRYFWQALGLKIGSRSTGTLCCPARQEDVREEEVVKVREYLRKRTLGGKGLITKNPHLLNKIPFLARMLPDARFVLIIRDPMSVVASKKLLFQGANLQNEDYPPFIHYWPEGKLPCWWALRDDRSGFAITRGSIRRMGKEAFRALGLKKRKVLTAPGKLFGHEKLSTFLPEHPDHSRYYPGSGFARIPEAWLTLNANACQDLRAIGDARWLPLTYAELVANPRQAIARICEFADISAPEISSIPERLDESRAEKWRTDLSEEEQAILIDRIQNQGASDLKLLSDICRRDLLAA